MMGIHFAGFARQGSRPALIRQELSGRNRLRSLTATALLIFLFAACSEEKSEIEVLRNCWGASSTGHAGQSQVQLKGVVLNGIEGSGAWSYSERCPGSRVRIRFSPSVSTLTLDNAVRTNLYRGLFMTGFEGDMTVTVHPEAPSDIGLLVTKVDALVVLSDEAALAYMKQYGV